RRVVHGHYCSAHWEMGRRSWNGSAGTPMAANASATQRGVSPKRIAAPRRSAVLHAETSSCAPIVSMESMRRRSTETSPDGLMHPSSSDCQWAARAAVRGPRMARAKGSWGCFAFVEQEALEGLDVVVGVDWGDGAGRSGERFALAATGDAGVDQPL